MTTGALETLLGSGPPLGSQILFPAFNGAATISVGGGTYLKSGVFTLASNYPGVPSALQIAINTSTISANSLLGATASVSPTNSTSISSNYGVAGREGPLAASSTAGTFMLGDSSGAYYLSTDGGQTYTKTAGTTSSQCVALCYVSSSSMWVSVCQNGYVYTSTNNGASWTTANNSLASTISANGFGQGFACSNGTTCVVGVAYSGQTTSALIYFNGTSWSYVGSFPADTNGYGPQQGVVWTGTYYVYLTYYGYCGYSTTGASFTLTGSAVMSSCLSYSYGNGTLVAIPNSGSAIYTASGSSAPTSWTSKTVAFSIGGSSQATIRWTGNFWYFGLTTSVLTSADFTTTVVKTTNSLGTYCCVSGGYIVSAYSSATYVQYIPASGTYIFNNTSSQAPSGTSLTYYMRVA